MWIIDRPNNVRAKQIALQKYNGVTPVFWRGGRSKVYVSAYMVLFTAAFVGSNYQLVQYIRGKAKKVGEE